MTLYDKIIEYLDEKQRDFQEGLNLYIKASNHRSMMLYLQRKKNAEKLEYELQKLLKYAPAKLRKILVPDSKHVVNESDNTGKSEPGVKGTGETVTQSNEVGDNTGTGCKTEESSGTSEQTNTDGNDQDPDHKIVEFRTVKPEELPEEMKPLYDEIAQKHKEMRSIHEKMKLAETDEVRAELRKQLVDNDDFVAAGWKTIDEFMLLKLQPTVEKKKDPPEEKKEASVSDIAKEISAARTFLSRGIADYKKAEESKKAGLKKKLENRIKILIDNKASVSKKTKKSLIELAIISEKSKLLAE